MCGKEFEAKLDKIHKGKYCSVQCYYKGRWGESRTESVPCRQCGTIFKKHRADKKYFCTKECQFKWRSIHFRGKNHPRFKGKIRYGSGQKYLTIYAPYHPFADSKGYMFEHRIMMEKKLMRFLTPGEIVHHTNGNTLDNRIENLELMTVSQHSSLHTQRMWDEIKANPDIPNKLHKF
uniref:Putative homing endonuclease n=1 Tax=viral metagenome TaxID=1070528 RepID=A0A6M3LEH5_9ZZZZ